MHVMICLLTKYPQDGHAERDIRNVWFYSPVYTSLQKDVPSKLHLHLSIQNIMRFLSLFYQGQLQLNERDTESPKVSPRAERKAVPDVFVNDQESEDDIESEEDLDEMSNYGIIYNRI